jgi:acyl carrier protein
MTDLEQRIIGMLADERGIKPHRILLSSRLVQDLGMDGDDAVEFFGHFGKALNVELAELHSHWDEHFGPEGGGPSLGYMGVIGAAVVFGDLLHRVLPWLHAWASMLVLLIVFGWVFNRLFPAPEGRMTTPVTVGDLVDAAREGRWNKAYDTDPLFRNVL